MIDSVLKDRYQRCLALIRPQFIHTATHYRSVNIELKTYGVITLLASPCGQPYKEIASPICGFSAEIY